MHRAKEDPGLTQRPRGFRLRVPTRDREGGLGTVPAGWDCIWGAAEAFAPRTHVRERPPLVRAAFSNPTLGYPAGAGEFAPEAGFSINITDSSAKGSP